VPARSFAGKPSPYNSTRRPSPACATSRSTGPTTRSTPGSTRRPAADDPRSSSTSTAAASSAATSTRTTSRAACSAARPGTSCSAWPTAAPPSTRSPPRTTTRWAQDHALHLGADPTHVTVGGDSAGANLATATAQATRDDRPPAAQLVIYPTVDTPTDRPSRSLFDGFFLADSERSGYFEVYTRRTDAPADDPRLSPIYGPLDGLAPALVVVAGFDVLRDESEAYAEALRAAGSRVLMQREPSLPHGFVNMTGVSRTARRATAEMAHRWHEVVATVR
jgi:hypothetical protein